MDIIGFKKWLDDTTEYQKATKSNIMSRLKRANSILPIKNENVYVFHLSQEKDFQILSVSVKSQMRRAVRLYLQYLDYKDGITNET